MSVSASRIRKVDQEPQSCRKLLEYVTRVNHTIFAQRLSLADLNRRGDGRDGSLRLWKDHIAPGAGFSEGICTQLPPSRADPFRWKGATIIDDTPNQPICRAGRGTHWLFVGCGNLDFCCKTCLAKVMNLKPPLMRAWLTWCSSLPRHEINRRVDDLIQSFGLQNSRATLIGTPIRKGISGGQKRRVVVASQLITAPKVLFLDEPTSGLDSTASFEVISYIKSVAKKYNVSLSSSTSSQLADYILVDRNRQHSPAIHSDLCSLR